MSDTQDPFERAMYRLNTALRAEADSNAAVSEPTRLKNRAVPASAHWKDDPPHDVDEFCDDCIVPFTEMQEARAAAEQERHAEALATEREWWLAQKGELDAANAARAAAERDVAALRESLIYLVRDVIAAKVQSKGPANLTNWGEVNVSLDRAEAILAEPAAEPKP